MRPKQFREAKHIPRECTPAHTRSSVILRTIPFNILHIVTHIQTYTPQKAIISESTCPTAYISMAARSCCLKLAVMSCVSREREPRFNM